MTYGGLHSDECCLWTSVVVSLLTSSPSTSPSSPYDLRLCSGSPHLKSPRVTIAPHSGLERRHRGPQCPLWNHRAPFCSQISHSPTTVLHLVTHCCPRHPIYTCGGGGRGVCSSHDFTPPPTPQHLTHALCVCVLCVHHPPKKKQKEGLTDCRGGTSFITFDAVLLAVF